MRDNVLGTKNVPDATEWHFAKYWDYLLDKIELYKYELENSLKKIIKDNRMFYCISNYGKTSESEMLSKSKITKKIIESL
jgi:hypothetical protein